MPNQKQMKCQCGAAVIVSNLAAGREVRCPGCGRSHTVPPGRADRAPHGAAARPAPRREAADSGEDALSESTDGQWIRVMCKCGKPMKAPAAWAGRRAQCPRCKFKMILPVGAEREKRHDPMDVFYDPDATEDDIADLTRSRDGRISKRMEESGSNLADGYFEDLDREPDIGSIDAKEATGIMESLADGEEIEPMPFIPVPPPPEADELEKFLRATCSCGKMVRAPLHLAGKIGLCPKCFQEIAMPLMPGKVRRVFDLASDRQTVNERSATVLGMDAIRDDAVPPEPEHPAARQMPEIAEAIKNLPPVPEIVRAREEVPKDFVLTGEKPSSDEIQMRRHAIYDRLKENEKFKVRLVVFELFMLPVRLLQLFVKVPFAAFAVILILAIAGGAAFLIRGISFWGVAAKAPAAHARNYYFDMSTGKVFEMDDADYAQRVVQGVKARPGSEFPVVLAYVFGCGSCESTQRQVAFLERFTPSALQMREDLNGLVKGGNGSTDRAAELTKLIGEGNLVARIHLDPVVFAPGIPESIGAGAFAAKPKAGLATASTAAATQASDDGDPVSELVLRLAWKKYDEAKGSIMTTPLPGCEKVATPCFPESK